MLYRKLLTALVLAGTILVPTASFAAPANSAPCIFQEHHVVSVTPYRVEDRVGRTSFQVLRGAAVYVQAEPGLTAEWLRHRFEQHVTDTRQVAMSDCALDAGDVRVEVESSGSGFLVKLIAPNTAKGEEVLRRARLLGPLSS